MVIAIERDYTDRILLDLTLDIDVGNCSKTQKDFYNKMRPIAEKVISGRYLICEKGKLKRVERNTPGSLIERKINLDEIPEDFLGLDNILKRIVYRIGPFKMNMNMYDKERHEYTHLIYDGFTLFAPALAAEKRKNTNSFNGAILNLSNP